MSETKTIKSAWLDAYENLSTWYYEFELTIDEVRERCQWADWTSDFWLDMEYWCILFYGESIFGD